MSAAAPDLKQRLAVRGVVPMAAAREKPKLGDEEGAVDHFRELRLNSGDNQGTRYLLAGCLLRRGAARRGAARTRR